MWILLPLEQVLNQLELVQINASSGKVLMELQLTVYIAMMDMDQLHYLQTELHLLNHNALNVTLDAIVAQLVDQV